MSAEEFRETVERALGEAYGSGADPEELDAVLEEMQERVDGLRAIHGGQA
jgi:hypothetical protein